MKVTKEIFLNHYDRHKEKISILLRNNGLLNFADNLERCSEARLADEIEFWIDRAYYYLPPEVLQKRMEGVNNLESIYHLCTIK